MTSLLIIGVLMLLAMFSIGWFFAWLTTSNYYEQRIRQGEYFTPQQEKEIEEIKEIAKKAVNSFERKTKRIDNSMKAYAKKQREVSINKCKQKKC